MGDETRGYINYAGLAEDVKPGDRILIDDGLIELHVREVNGTDIVCRIENGGELGEKKGVNVPGVRVKLPALTDKDKEDIRFGVDAGFDFVAVRPQCRCDPRDPGDSGRKRFCHADYRENRE